MENKNMKEIKIPNLDEMEIGLGELEIEIDENILDENIREDEKLNTDSDIESIIEGPVRDTISTHHNELAQEKIDELDGEIYDFDKEIENLNKAIDEKSKELLEIQLSINPEFSFQNRDTVEKHFENLSQNNPDLYSKSVDLINKARNIDEEIKEIKSEKKHTMYNYESYNLYLDVCNMSDCVEAYSVLNEFEDEIPQSIEDIDAEIREALKNESEKPQNIEIKEKIITYGELLLNSIKEGNLRPYNEEMDKLLY